MLIEDFTSAETLFSCQAPEMIHQKNLLTFHRHNSRLHQLDLYQNKKLFWFRFGFTLFYFSVLNKVEAGDLCFLVRCDWFLTCLSIARLST